MKKSMLLALITAASLCANDGVAGFHAYKGEPLTKRIIGWAGKGSVLAVEKLMSPIAWAVKPAWGDNKTFSLRDGVWQQVLKRVGVVYVITSLAVLPLCSNFVCGSRDADLVADRLIQKRIPAGEAGNLVIYSDGEGEQKFGVARNSRLVFWQNDADHSAVAPLTGRRWDFVPFVDIDGFHSADGMWQAINWDLLPDIVLAKRVGREEVVEVSIAGEITGNVRIKDGSSVMIGQGIVKLADKNSDKKLYAVLIDREFALETLDNTGNAVLVEQDIEPYFKFLTPEKFAAGEAAAQAAAN